MVYFYLSVNLSPYSVDLGGGVGGGGVGNGSAVGGGVGGGGGGGGGGDTSPKPLARSGREQQKISTDKRPSKLHHGNKGKKRSMFESLTVTVSNFIVS
jgi:hypothetical protein